MESGVLNGWESLIDKEKKNISDDLIEFLNYQNIFPKKHEFGGFTCYCKICKTEIKASEYQFKIDIRNKYSRVQNETLKPNFRSENIGNGSDFNRLVAIIMYHNFNCHKNKLYDEINIEGITKRLKDDKKEFLTDIFNKTIEKYESDDGDKLGYASELIFKLKTDLQRLEHDKELFELKCKGMIDDRNLEYKLEYNKKVVEYEDIRKKMTDYYDKKNQELYVRENELILKNKELEIRLKELVSKDKELLNRETKLLDEIKKNNQITADMDKLIKERICEHVKKLDLSNINIDTLINDMQYGQNGQTNKRKDLLAHF
jgi:hypothetical protein